MADSNTNTKACSTDTKIPMPMKGIGRPTAKIAEKINTTLWSPVMFPNKRMESERGRTRWLMISIGSIRGTSTGIGPKNCLM